MFYYNILKNKCRAVASSDCTAFLWLAPIQPSGRSLRGGLLCGRTSTIYQTVNFVFVKIARPTNRLFVLIISLYCSVAQGSGDRKTNSPVIGICGTIFFHLATLSVFPTVLFSHNSPLIIQPYSSLWPFPDQDESRLSPSLLNQDGVF